MMKGGFIAVFGRDVAARTTRVSEPEIDHYVFGRHDKTVVCRHCDPAIHFGMPVR